MNRLTSLFCLAAGLLAASAFAETAAAPASGPETSAAAVAAPVGVSIAADSIVGGDLKIYTGPVRITETATERVHLEAQPGQLLFRRISTVVEGDAIGATPFDPTTETIQFIGGDLVLRDALGHSVTIHPATGAATPFPDAAAAAAVVDSAAASAAAAAATPPPPTPKKRRVDPVTDRGHVIP